MHNSWNNLTPIPCPVGYYVGNRLGFANEHIYYWQGTPNNTSKWICGGDAFFMFVIPQPVRRGTPIIVEEKKIGEAIESRP